MNFPHETENSYLSGGNCLNPGVNSSGEVYFKEFLYLCLPLTTHEIIRRMKSIKSHITQLLKSLNEGVFEKEHTIALSLLSAMAGESIFLLGPPGVAKSLVARRLKLAFKGADAFEYLMSRFSTPDEIFGPVSISKLKDEDTYERITKGYLPTASIVFLDEIWKAGPAIQNSLLTVINEKIYRNGQFTVRVPLKALIAASNELPAKGEGLEALYDRFLIRQFVGCIEQEYAFDQMISSTREIEPEIPEKLQVDDELYNQIQAESEKVGIHYTIFELIHHIKREIEQYNTGRDENTPPIYVSDRRWKKIVGLLRTSAYLNESPGIHFSDCLLMSACLWDEIPQLPIIEEIVEQSIARGINTYLLGEKRLEQKLDTLKENMKSEHSLRELSDPGIQVVDTFYHRIEGYHIAGNLLIFASDYQSLKKDSNRLFYIQQDKFRPVNKILKAYDFVKNRNIAQKNIYSLRKGRRSVFVNNQEYPLLCYDNCDPLPAQQDGSTPFEFTLQEVIDLLHQMEVEYKTISERETAYIKDHLFLSSSQKSKIKRILGETAHIIENYRNELRIIAHAHEQENREY